MRKRKSTHTIIKNGRNGYTTTKCDEDVENVIWLGYETANTEIKITREDATTLTYYKTLSNLK